MWRFATVGSFFGFFVFKPLKNEGFFSCFSEGSSSSIAGSSSSPSELSPSASGSSLASDSSSSSDSSISSDSSSEIEAVSFSEWSSSSFASSLSVSSVSASSAFSSAFFSKYSLFLFCQADNSVILSSVGVFLLSSVIFSLTDIFLKQAIKIV